ncbi:MAG: hypothetical protein LBQ88_14655 [Treponema sp.]|jgi:hypothetical protein|nr:hypothetical protein [Treponema sp.]
MGNILKCIAVTLLFFAISGAVFSQEKAEEGNTPSSSSKDIKKLVSGAFSFYPTFKFGSKDEDKNLTDTELESNIAFSLQMGLSLYKNFKFLFSTDINGTNIEDTPLGWLAKLTSSVGYKSALFGIRVQNIGGSMEWESTNPAQTTGPVKREDFSIRMTAMELQYDISSFFKYFSEHGWGGLFIGLEYFSYTGAAKVKFDNILYHYDPEVEFNGFGFSVGIDTLNGYLLYGFEPGTHFSFGPNKKFTLLPWFRFNLDWSFGNMKLSDTALGYLKDNTAISAKNRGNIEESYITGINIINGIMGAALLYNTRFMDITFALGYNFLFIDGGINTLLHNEGLIFRTSFSF